MDGLVALKDENTDPLELAKNSGAPQCLIFPVKGRGRGRRNKSSVLVEPGLPPASPKPGPGKGRGRGRGRGRARMVSTSDEDDIQTLAPPKDTPELPEILCEALKLSEPSQELDNVSEEPKENKEPKVKAKKSVSGRDNDWRSKDSTVPTDEDVFNPAKYKKKFVKKTPVDHEEEERRWNGGGGGSERKKCIVKPPQVLDRAIRQPRGPDPDSNGFAPRVLPQA